MNTFSTSSQSPLAPTRGDSFWTDLARASSVIGVAAGALARALASVQDGAQASPAKSLLPNYVSTLLGAKPLPVVTVNPGVAISTHGVQVVRDALSDAGLASATITSGRRSIQSQADIMYRNIVMFGVPSQLELYGSSGDKVIRAYEVAKAAGKSQDAIIADMVKAIYAAGPTNVSNHISDVKDTIDVAPSSISNATAFVAALERAKQRGVITKYIVEGKGRAIHIDV